ncbi:MAG: FAD-binding protein [Desulfotomaculum sp.]|nr:FAD-binding protein [Desulfotomaculum sp.]
MAAMTTAAMLEELRGLMTTGEIICDLETLGEFTADAAVSGSVIPICAVQPVTTGEVAKIMRYSYQKDMPVFPAGAQTGLSGGAVPTTAGISLSLTKMNRILEINAEDRYAIVEPGVITADLDQAVEPYGLTYPVDLASREWSTIGGNIAKNAGGLSAIKYGVTRDYVKGLEVVLPGGAVIRTGAKTVKSVVGYDLTRLFVGSEGTLGIVTKAILSLIPRPKTSQNIFIVFDSLKETVAVIKDIFEVGLTPRMVEILDNMSLAVIKDYLPVWSDNMNGALLIECDGCPAQVQDEINEIMSILKNKSALYLKNYQKENAEYQKIYQGRFLLAKLLPVGYGTVVFEDLTTPRSQTWVFMEHMYALAAERGIVLTCFGHAGDGNLHVVLMHKKEEQEELILELVEELIRYCLTLGGTISGEHGIGLAKVRFLPLELSSDEIAIMRGIKQSLDPKGLLNPGKILG